MTEIDHSLAKILIVDDDPLVCHVIRLQLERSGHDDLATAHDGQEAIMAVASSEPDIVLLDITMPDMTGLEALSVIKATSPHSKVIMLTGQARSDYVAEAIAKGASGYLVKKVPDLNTLTESIKLVIEGDAIIVDQQLLREAAKKIASRNTSNGDSETAGGHLTDNLTSQELKVLRLIAAGLTNQEISLALHISYNTVKSHVRNIYQKLRVSDRTQAAIMALRRGISPESKDDDE